ncbi:uncharacterized membrane protein C6F6.13c [Trichoderma asperellum]|uniref:Uncharacterized membrane protein C6F6.13c n=1 Tax=Trichoderma asperellum TaxID=101201 RepID=A0A6V8QQQ6_TRIAP|nr:uncharacterized membrane protein C6F6.13c [Trichoderma asperellum]
MKRIGSSKTFDRPHETIEKEEKEAMTPQLRELKKEALIFFRKWQNIVLQRVRDIAVSDHPVSQLNTRGRGRGMRGMPRGRGGVGRGGGIMRSPLTLATGPPRAPSNYVDRSLAAQFPPIPNALWTLDMDKPRTALDLSEEDAIAQKSEETKTSRRWKLGLGNHSGKLAAPLAAVGIGAAHGGLGLTSYTAAGLLGIMAENALAIGSLFGINTLKPLGKMMETFAREVTDFAFIPIHSTDVSEYRDPRGIPAEHRRLCLTIAIGGYVIGDEDITKTWHCLGRYTETFATRWETAALTSLGSSLDTVIKSSSWSSAQAEIKSRTIFSSLVDAVWPMSLLKVSKILDNPWNVAIVRAEKAGAVFADAIMRQKFHGDRPVSLVGYGLGARAIYTCLMVLAERRQFGVIDSVVMMGTPAPSESRVWLTLKSVVCGRLVNVYSEHDYMLGFLYRTANIQFGVAGLQEIQGADGVENYRMKSLPRGHLTYQSQVSQILKNIGWEDAITDAIKVGK